MQRFAHPQPLIRLGLVTAFGLALRLLWIFNFPGGFYADSTWYYDQAVNLAQGLGYTYRDVPTAIWPVGYPLFLSLFFRLGGPSLWLAQIVNVVLLSIDLLLIFVIAHRLGATKRAALSATALLAIAPSHIISSGLAATEPLFVVLLHGQILLLIAAVRRSSMGLWLLNGAWLGLGVYVRSELFFLLPLLLLACLVTGWQKKPRCARPILMALATALVFGATLTPWTVRNYRVQGLLIPVSTTGCMNLWIGNTAAGNGAFYWPRDPEINPTVLREDDTETTWYRRSCDAAQKAILEDPARVLRRLPRKLFFLWENDSDMIYWSLAGATSEIDDQTRQMLYRITNAYYWPLLALGLAAMVLLIPRDKGSVNTGLCTDAYWLVTGVFLSLNLAYLPFFGTSRFHFGTFPLLLIFAACGLNATLRYFTTSHSAASKPSVTRSQS